MRRRTAPARFYEDKELAIAKKARAAIVANIPTEDQEQKTVVQWLEWNKITYHHSPNGGVRHITTARRLKAQGTKAGFPDLIILDQPPAMTGCHSTAIEMKRSKGGRPSPEQLEWIEKLAARGWYTAICNGADHAIDLLKRLGYGTR